MYMKKRKLMIWVFGVGGDGGLAGRHGILHKSSPSVVVGEKFFHEKSVIFDIWIVEKGVIF